MDVSTDFLHRIHQDTDGPLLHTFGTSKGEAALHKVQVCRQETHRSTSRADVNCIIARLRVGSNLKYTVQCYSVCGLRKILNINLTLTLRLDNESTIALGF